MLSGRAAYTNIKLALALLLLLPFSLQAQSWQRVPGVFLEPNRFGVVSEVNDSYLWLEAGFGRDIVKGDVAFGLEGLIWSRLRNLSGFRFPVETADYFFGGYVTFKALGANHRVRISHISAHLVDGADTVVGGSSSRFSREFISLERAISNRLLGISMFGSLGVRYVFHQVTEVEPSLQLPVALNFTIANFGDLRDSTSALAKFYLTLSGDAGPSWRAGSLGLSTRLALHRSSAIDIFGRYYFGLSRAGIEGERREEQFEIGVHLIPFEWFD